MAPSDICPFHTPVEKTGFPTKLRYHGLDKYKVVPLSQLLIIFNVSPGWILLAAIKNNELVLPAFSVGSTPVTVCQSDVAALLQSPEMVTVRTCGAA